MLAGVAIGIVVATLGLANTYRLEREIQDFSIKCVAEGEKGQKNSKFDPDSAVLIEAWKPPADAVLVCDPEDLAPLRSASIPLGVQGEIVRAKLELNSSREWPLWLAMAIALALSMPFVWYFFLNRIKELREVIVGK